MKTERLLSISEKNKNDKQWYKDTIDSLIQTTFFSNVESSGLDKQQMEVNYNLFNGLIDEKDFEYVYKPLGGESANLPADFTNKDIISAKTTTTAITIAVIVIVSLRVGQTTLASSNLAAWKKAQKRRP